jgi:hypothetical protein
VPEQAGLSGLSPKVRRDIAQKTTVRLRPGEGSQSRYLAVLDRGIGVTPEQFERTILSLNESNKVQKHYLAGTYGQGGSSTFNFCKLSLIASRAFGSEKVCFTTVKYQDLPPEEYKTGRYVYLALDDAPLTCFAEEEDEAHGTFVAHFGFDLTKYPAPLGPRIP